MTNTSVSTRSIGGRTRGWTTGFRFLRLAAALLISPWLAREAMAQRPAAIGINCVVLPPIVTYALLPDTLDVDAHPGTQRFRIAGAGVLDIQSGNGAAVRVAERPARPSVGTDVITPDAERPRRIIQVTVDFIDN